MQQQKYFLILFFFAINTFYGQVILDKATHNEQIKKNNIVLRNRDTLISMQFASLTGSIEQTNKQLSLLVHKQQIKSDILEEQLKQASSTISTQNSLLGWYGVVFTILASLIAIVTIGFPIYINQVSIRPSQKKIKELEEGMGKKFEKFNVIMRNKQINQAINALKSGNVELQANARAFLSFTHHQRFTDFQLSKLVLLLKSTGTDQTTKTSICYVISNQECEHTTTYFIEALKDEKNTDVKFAAIKYFTTIGIDNYLEVFREMLLKASNKNSEFVAILTNVSSTHSKPVNVLINDKTFIDYLDNIALKDLKVKLATYKTIWKLSEDDLKNSYLFKQTQAVA